MVILFVCLLAFQHIKNFPWLVGIHLQPVWCNFIQVDARHSKTSLGPPGNSYSTGLPGTLCWSKCDGEKGKKEKWDGSCAVEGGRTEEVKVVNGRLMWGACLSSGVMKTSRPGCCQGLYLGLWSYHSQYLYGHPWLMLPPKATRMASVWAATCDHVGIRWPWGPWQSGWPVLPSGAIVTFRSGCWQGPCLVPWSYCSKGLCWSPRLMLPPKVTRKPRGRAAICGLVGVQGTLTTTRAILISVTWASTKSQDVIQAGTAHEGHVRVNCPAIAGPSIDVCDLCHLGGHMNHEWWN